MQARDDVTHVVKMLPLSLNTCYHVRMLFWIRQRILHILACLYNIFYTRSPQALQQREYLLTVFNALLGV